MSMYLVIIFTNIWMTSWMSEKRKAFAYTLSDSPWAVARALALWAWTGLRVIPWHLAPNLLAMHLELPPIPHPTSTTLFWPFYWVLCKPIQKKQEAVESPSFHSQTSAQAHLEVQRKVWTEKLQCSNNFNNL